MDFCTSIGQVYAKHARRPMQTRTNPDSFESVEDTIKTQT